MNVIQTEINGVVIIEPRVFGDSRGYFFESFSEKNFKEQVADVAKKLIPVVATVAVACVVAGAVKKSQKKNNQAGLIQTTRYYPC